MKIYRCQHCSYNVMVRKSDKGVRSAKYLMGLHYETIHKELIPGDLTGFQWFYYLLTGKKCGSCVMCHNPTTFNNISMKYSRFCNNPACIQKYREEFKNRMIQKHGKVHLLNDPEKQKEMLAKRRISSEYTWSDRSTKIHYTGSYELDFLKLLDNEYHWNPTDIMSPSPHVYMYKYKDTDHFYIPDFFIPSMNLEIEIKSMEMKNVNPDSRAKDIIKDELMKSNINYIDYIKIVEKDYTAFIEKIKED